MRVSVAIGVTVLAFGALSPAGIDPSRGSGEAVASAVKGKPQTRKAPARRKATAVRPAPPVARGLYEAAFTKPLHNGRYGQFPSRINPLVSQEFPATPEYTYLYTPGSVVTTAPNAPNYVYSADTRFLLSPVSGERATAEAYSWNRSFIQQASARMMGQMRSRPVGRDPGKKIDNTLDPNGLAPEGPASGLDAALRELRLPAPLSR